MGEQRHARTPSEKVPDSLPEPWLCSSSLAAVRRRILKPSAAIAKSKASLFGGDCC
jgi:hypothetical protein